MFEKLTNNSARWFGRGLVILYPRAQLRCLQQQPLSLLQSYGAGVMDNIYTPAPASSPPPHRIEEVYTIDRG